MSAFLILLIVLAGLAGYASVAITTYVLNYAPLYREHAASHDDGTCKCPCLRVEATLRDPFRWGEDDIAPAEWERERQQEFYRQQREKRELQETHILRMIAEEKSRIRENKNREYAKSVAQFCAWLWPLVGTWCALTFVGRHLRRGVKVVLTRPVQHVAELPLINERRREATRQEAIALRERFERDIQNGD